MFKGNTGNTLTRKVLAVLASQIFVTQVVLYLEIKV